MLTRSRLFAAVLLAAPLALLSLEGVAAQTANTEAAADFCDYCKDYTDAATDAGTPSTAYRPLSGYAAEPSKQAESEKMRQEAVIAMRTRVLKPTATE